jgi:hypothetical protein
MTYIQYIDFRPQQIIKAKDRSSIALVHYFSVDKANSDEAINDSNQTEFVDEKDSEKDKVIFAMKIQKICSKKKKGKTTLAKPTQILD